MLGNNNLCHFTFIIHFSHVQKAAKRKPLYSVNVRISFFFLHAKTSEREYCLLFRIRLYLADKESHTYTTQDRLSVK